MRALPWCLVLSLPLLLLTQCGGGASSAEPKWAASDAHSGSSEGDAEAAGEGVQAEASAARDEPKGPSCDDGTCSPCGAGICPSGWYCDENASGGAACSWLKECVDKPGCGCVTRVLGAACKCREEGGGLKVSCGSRARA